MTEVDSEEDFFFFFIYRQESQKKLLKMSTSKFIPKPRPHSVIHDMEKIHYQQVKQSQRVCLELIN